ncbi:MAG: SpoIIE family protein phosphatase [Flavobacteriia bacterium]|nr:SpoIIE family protein phosphatase [Flavobacteriia bacterium]
MTKSTIFFLIIRSIKILFFSFCLSNISFGLNIDKVYEAKLSKAKHDTIKLQLYLDWINDINETDNAKKVELFKKIKKNNYYKKFNYHKSLLSEAKFYSNKGEFKKAISLVFKTINEAKKLDNYTKADYTGRGNSLLATIYKSEENYETAIYYQKLSIKEYKKLIPYSKNDESFYYAFQMNLADLYRLNKQVEKAISLYNFIEKKLIEFNDKENLYFLYTGKLACYEKNLNFKEKIILLNKAEKIAKEYFNDDPSYIAYIHNSLGSAYEYNNNFLNAIIHYNEANEIFKKLKDINNQMILSYNLALIYKKLKQFEKSNNYMLQYLSMKDTIFNMETKQTIHDLSIKYETEKKEQENKLLTKENEKKQLTIYFVLVAICLVLTVLIVIYRNSRIKSRINKELAEKNKIIHEQKVIVEEQHKEITDSIKYAERIQGAILPPDQKWLKILPNSFVLNKPKDILSGDFYWIAQTDEHIFVAAADCTGHGVPGALISIVNFNLLNKAVLEKGLKNPGEVLDAVNIWLTESLNQTIENSSIKDGMDVALVSINKKTGQILYSGANNPLYWFHKNELIEIKADKFPVGAFINEDVQHFTTKEIPAQFGDTLYLFSDGFADQFGGPLGKKYKYKQLKEKFFEILQEPMEEQKIKLEIEFRSWKGEYEQTDDVLIIGIQVNSNSSSKLI